MNDLQRDRPVEQAVADWMDRAAPTQAPARLLENTFVETMKAPQARAYPWHRIKLAGGSAGRWGPSARLSLVVLGLLLAATFALALAGGSGAPQATVGATATAGPPTPSNPFGGIALPASIPITADATVTVPDLLGFGITASQLTGLIPGQLVRIDLSTGEITDSVALGAATDLYNGFAANDAGLWATDWDQATLYRVDPKTFKVVKAIPAGFAPKGVLANAGGVWVADTHYGTVMRIDPATDSIADTITVGPIGPSGPNWLASGLDSIWVDIPNDATIVRIDPATDKIQATIAVPDGFTACGGLAIGTAAVWVSGCDASPAVERFDPATNLAVTTIDLPGHGGPTLIADVPWVSVDTGDEEGGLIVRIDPATNTIDRVLVPDLPFGGGGGIAVVGSSVWVHDWSHGRLLRFPLADFGT